MSNQSFLSFVIFMTLVFGDLKPLLAQNQNPNWALFTSNSVSNSAMNFKFEPSPVADVSPPTYKKVAGNFTDENNALITSIRGFNSFFDADGFPVLYVINADEKTYIYDKHGVKYTKKHENPNGAYHHYKQELGQAFIPFYENKSYVEKFKSQNLGSLDNHELKNTSREISILKVGCNKLHVIVGEMIIEVDLTLKSWDYFIPYQLSPPANFNSNFLNGNGIKSLEMGHGSINWNESFHSIRRDPTDESKYIIYYLYSTGAIVGIGDSRPVFLNTIKVDATNYTINYGTPFYLRSASLPQSFGNANQQYISELEVSPDGNKIAIHDDSKVLVYTINSTTKDVNGFSGYYNFASTNASVLNVISGLEFTAQSNKLVFNRFNANATSSSSLTNNIGVLNLSASYTNFAIPVSFVTETATGKSHSTITRGGLELGRNGEIYSVGETGIYKIDLTAMELNEVPISISSGSINLLNDVFMGAPMATRPLPEQIDGQTFVSEGYHLDDEELSNITIDNTFTSTGKVKIRGEIKIMPQSGTFVRFLNTNVSPATNSKIVVKSASELIIASTNIETDACNIMWTGIVVENGGLLYVLNTTNEIKYIKDAITAIDYTGLNSGLHVTNYTFNRNATGIKIVNGAVSAGIGTIGSTSIKNSFFYNTEVLKDPSKGQSAINMQNVGKGNISIELFNTGTNASKLLLANNYFEGGLFGVKATNSYLRITECVFKNHLGISSLSFFPRIKFNYAAAIFAEKVGTNWVKYDLEIDQHTNNNVRNVFDNNERHVVAYNGVNLFIKATDFISSYQNGVEWIKNKGCSLNVVENAFLNCANSNIFCDDNAMPSSNNKSHINITLNSFNNNKYNLSGTIGSTIHQFDGNAITINDLGKTASTGYSDLLVSNNTITNLRGGILLNGVTGNETNLTRPENTVLYDIRNNSILIRPKTNTLFPNGVQFVNSTKLAAMANNKITSIDDPIFSNRGNGIYIENSPLVSLKNNHLSSKNGVRGKMVNTGSEILCNTFYQNRFGINLSDRHVLRPHFRTHGIGAQESRTNTFIKSGISDLHRVNSISEVRNWWIIEYNGFMKETCFRNGTTRNCFAGSNTISYLVQGYAPNFCAGGGPSDTLPTSGNDTINDPIIKWEMDYSDAVFEMNTNTGYELTPKIRIISAIELVQQNQFQEAVAMLNTEFSDSLDNKFVEVLSTYIGLNYPNPIEPTNQIKNYFTNIAQQVPSATGSHVYIARNIMRSLFDEQFGELDSSYQDVFVSLMNTNCIGSEAELNVRLVNELGAELPISFSFDSLYNLQIFGEYLAELVTNETYTIKVSHFQEDYQLSGTLSELFQNNNQIYLNCSLNLGKKANQSMQENQTSLNIYPNPTNGTVWIKGFSEAKSVLDLTLIDILGRKVFDASAFDANKPIDLNQIAPGIYYLLVKGSGIDQKFMLKKE